jgi:hypothetical protein
LSKTFVTIGRSSPENHINYLLAAKHFLPMEAAG